MAARYFALQRIEKPEFDSEGNPEYWERGDEVEGASTWPNLEACVRTGQIGPEPVEDESPAPGSKPAKKPKAKDKPKAAPKPDADASTETQEPDAPSDQGDPYEAAGIVFGEPCPSCGAKHKGPGKGAAECAEKLTAAA